MRVLPVSSVNYQSKTNSFKPNKSQTLQYNPVTTNNAPAFKGTGAAATFFGVILGGAAAVFAAPLALVLGATAAGALGGAIMSESGGSLNEGERYKQTHEY